MSAGLPPWMDRQILVCLGGGGVGKTTVSAALALRAALAGRRALVLTVDPARRLAGALGLVDLPSRPAPVPPDALAAAGIATGGRFAAMMIDQASAWDRLLERHATAEARERLLASPFYQALSRRFAGSTEYLAVDEIAGLAAGSEFDLVVLDTPPGERAIEFLDAPSRARSLLDRRVLGWLPHRRRAGSALGPARRLARALEQAVGGAAVADLAAFLGAAGELAGVLAARARAAHAALTSPRTGVLLVTTPDARAITAALDLAGATGRLGLHLAGIVVNRVHPTWPEPVSRDDLAAALAAAGIARHASWLAENFAGHERRAGGEARRIEDLRAGLPPGLPLVAIPAFEADVHDLAALAGAAACLVSDGEAGEGGADPRARARRANR